VDSGRDAVTTTSTLCLLLGEVDSVEHLLDDGGTVASTQHRLVVEVHQQAFLQVVAGGRPALAADDQRPDRLVKCVQQSADGRRRRRRRRRRRPAFFEELVDHLGALSDRTRAVLGTRHESTDDLQQPYTPSVMFRRRSMHVDAAYCYRRSSDVCLSVDRSRS